MSRCSTKDRKSSRAEIVGDGNNRCNQENLISQLKTGVNAMKLPVDNLVSNWAYMVMASLAWNLKSVVCSAVAGFRAVEE